MTEVLSRSATAVIFHEDGNRLLLHQRRDFRIWALPGGRLKDGEKPDQAAIRETFEETGYHIVTSGYIGEYHRPQFDDVRFVYRGHIVGGKAISRGAETREVAWFPLERLPFWLAPSVREFFSDSISGHKDPVLKEIIYPLWQLVVIRCLIWTRDRMNKFRERPPE